MIQKIVEKCQREIEEEEDGANQEVLRNTALNCFSGMSGVKEEDVQVIIVGDVLVGCCCFMFIFMFLFSFLSFVGELTFSSEVVITITH